MNKYDYYSIRIFYRDLKNDKFKYKYENFKSYDEAKQKYDSLVLNKNLVQVELLLEEHRENGQLIYENSLRMKTIEGETIWKND